MHNELKEVRDILGKDTATRSELIATTKQLGIPHVRFINSLVKLKRGHYSLEMPKKIEDTPKTATILPYEQKKRNILSQDDILKGYIPSKDTCFIPFGDFNLIDSIVKSKKFLPVVITGDSGNGKTKMVEQACAKNRRYFYRMNVTVETDEMDILGHYNLVDGQTIWEDSPLVEAAKTGGVVLMDEIFAGNPARMLCLQGILEGKPFLIKKTGERVIPAEGFNIIATDNTKGNGSESGRYIGTNIQNTAFLERFVMCIEHDYPSRPKEVKMLDKYIAYHQINVEDEKFTDKLCQWAEVTRKSYKDDAIDEMITTRRLFHILEIYSIVQDKEQAIHYAIARFDEEVRDSFVSLYKKIDDTIFDEHHQPVEKDDMVMLTVLVNETFHKNFPNEPNGTLPDEQVHEFIEFCNDVPEVSQLPQSFDRKNEAEEIKNTELLITQLYHEFVKKLEAENSVIDFALSQTS